MTAAFLAEVADAVGTARAHSEQRREALDLRMAACREDGRADAAERMWARACQRASDGATAAERDAAERVATLHLICAQIHRAAAVTLLQRSRDCVGAA